MAEESEFPQKILVVDDDASVAQGLEMLLERHTVKIHRAFDFQSALYLFSHMRFDAVFVELEFTSMPGLALIQKWRLDVDSEKRLTPFVLISGQIRTQADESLIREIGQVEILTKPFSYPKILACLTRVGSTRKRATAFEDFKEKVLNHYTDAGKFEKAAEVVRKNLTALGPGGLDILYELYEKANNFEAALTIVTRLLEASPNNISLLNSMGRLYLRLKRYQDAAVYLEKADALAPGKIDRINAMAEMYLSLNKPKETVKKFKELLHLTPENPELKFEMFSKLYEHGFDEEAIEFGKTAAQPIEIVRHYNNRGVLLSKGGRTEEALIQYDRAIRFFPKFKENYRIYFNKAVAHAFLKNRENYELAEAALVKCLELAPEFEKAIDKLESIQKVLSTKKNWS